MVGQTLLGRVAGLAQPDDASLLTWHGLVRSEIKERNAKPQGVEMGGALGAIVLGSASLWL